jgi:Domain of unknown function (DUF1707)
MNLEAHAGEPMTLEPGHGAAAGGYWQLRASTADRERAIDVLKAAFAEGRLDQDEYEERAGRVYGSRTYAELGALTYDLPVGPLGTLVPPPVAYRGPAYPALPTGERDWGIAAAGVTIGGFAVTMLVIYLLFLVLGS